MNADVGCPASAFSFPVPFGRSSGGCDADENRGARATNVMPAGVGYSSDECGLAGPARELLGRLEIERAAHDAAAFARERLARLNERRRSCGMAVSRANGSARPTWSRPPTKSGRPPRERLGPPYSTRDFLLYSARSSTAKRASLAVSPRRNPSNIESHIQSQSCSSLKAFPKMDRSTARSR